MLPPFKQAKNGAAMYGTKFRPELSPYVSRGHNDPVYSFYCSVCRREISCRHLGVADTTSMKNVNGVQIILHAIGI